MHRITHTTLVVFVGGLLLALMACAPARVSKVRPQPATHPAAPRESHAAYPSPAPAAHANNGWLLRDYGRFSVWQDCTERGPVRFEYRVAARGGLRVDLHGQPRADPELPATCQPFSLSDYGEGYARIFLVPSWVEPPTQVRNTDYVSTAIPAALGFRDGAWRYLRRLLACEQKPMQVIGGVYWGVAMKNDRFLISHRQRTPDAVWLVVVRGGDEAAAWFLPNHDEAGADRLDGYLLSVAALERLVDQRIDIDPRLKRKRPKATWPIPAGCNGRL